MEVRSLRGHLLRGTRRVPPPRPGHRCLHRDRRLAGRRHRAAPAAHHQPGQHAAQHRGDELHRGRAGHGRGRRAAPGVQQAVRADRAGRRPARAAVHPPPALGRRAAAAHVPPDGRARRAERAGVARDRPGPLHRPRPQPARAAGVARAGRAVEQRRLGARPGVRHAPRRHAGPRADGDHRHRLRHRRHPRRLPRPDASSSRGRTTR